jgi:large conductance mechanosensitive channel
VFKEFKEFAVKGNVLDMAVGVIMGAAFGKIVSTFTDGIMMPPIGKLMGGSFSDWIINLSDKDVKSLDEAKKLGAAVMTPGLLINSIIDFLIVAFVLFLLVKQVNRFKKAEPAPVPAVPTPDQQLLTEIRDLLKKR